MVMEQNEESRNSISYIIWFRKGRKEAGGGKTSLSNACCQDSLDMWEKKCILTRNFTIGKLNSR